MSNQPNKIVELSNNVYQTDVFDEIMVGLSKANKNLPTKLLYDTTGSKLFDRICETKEYYPTRTEEGIFDSYAMDIIRESSPSEIFEIGSGSSRKTNKLIDACFDLNLNPIYSAMDISSKALLMSAKKMETSYKNIKLNLFLGDYNTDLNKLPCSAGNKLYAFLGSTIGNFKNLDAIEFLKNISNFMDHKDFFLLGLDRVKETDIIDAAYNDSEGITKDFNLNILDVLKKQFNAKLDKNNFSHLAKYNEKLSQLEMFLLSNVKQDIIFKKDNKTFKVCLEKEEKILTEISQKFNKDKINNMFSNSGLITEKEYTSKNKYFSVFLLKKKLS